jgi:hypothetical protein
VFLLPLENEGWVLAVNLAVWTVFVADRFDRNVGRWAATPGWRSSTSAPVPPAVCAGAGEWLPRRPAARIAGAGGTWRVALI